MRTAAVKAWPVWREPRRVLAILAGVELLALAAPIVTWSPLSKGDIDMALMLASLSLIYSVFVMAWEKARRLLLFERAPALTPDVLATWCFASAILLPPSLAASVTAASAIGDWPSYNPAGTRPFYRYVYSTMASVLGATVASWTFRHHLPLGVALLAAAAAWVVIGPGATGLALCASGDLGSAKAMLRLESYRLEVTTMTVAAGEYATYRIGLPMLVWLSLPLAVAIQRYFTRAEMQSRTTDIRQPMDGQAWLHVAKIIVDASETVSILRIEAADSQTARLVAMLQSGCDAVGTYADGGLAILLPDCPPAQGDALARRLRIAMSYHKISCHIASASRPRDGQVLDDLLAVSEAELVLSRESSRRSASSL